MELIGWLCFAAGVTGLISPRLIRLPGRGAASGVLVLGLVLLTVSSGGGPEPSSTASPPGSSRTASPSATAPSSATPSQSSRAGLTSPGPTISAAASSPSASPSASATPTSAPAAGQVAQASGVTRARVTNVVDGDTIDVARLSGAPLPAARIRFIGVNTPESTSRVEPYGKQAAAYTSRALAGRVVWLTRDVSQTDRYGRSLRYVWLAPPPEHPRTVNLRANLFNAVLVVRGYAQVATYPPDVAYAEQLRAFEREARAAGRGLWGAGAAAGAAQQNSGGSAGSARSAGSTGSTSGGSGSGGAGGSGAGCDPHYSGGCVPPYPPDLDCSQLDVSGLTVEGADPHGLDGDGDGIACE